MRPTNNTKRSKGHILDRPPWPTVFDGIEQVQVNVKQVGMSQERSRNKTGTKRNQARLRSKIATTSSSSPNVPAFAARFKPAPRKKSPASPPVTKSGGAA